MKNISRYFHTYGVAVPIVRIARKGEAYRSATKPGWGVVEWFSEVTDTDWEGNPTTRMVIANRDKSDKTQVMYCDEDSSATLYPKYGREFVIAPYEEINIKDAPSQAETQAIIISGADGFDFWEHESGDVKIFVTYDSNGFVATYRLDNWSGKPYEDEVEISFEDLPCETEPKPIPCNF